MSKGDVRAINKQWKSGKPEVVPQHKIVQSTQPTLHRRSPDRGTTTQRTCMGCGNAPHPRFRCPAKDIQCHYFHKQGHFAKVCIKKGSMKLKLSH
jgi:hypothetical protein